MNTRYQARWISKERRTSLRKSGRLDGSMLLDSFNGFLIVEPVGSNFGDGKVLSRQEADFELRDVWCLEPRTKLSEARKRLQLEAEALEGATKPN